ncbi:MAG: hypothetical protein IJ859_09945 [Synergistaceae bacterium]|nr:hypothetical protein [Synergistaceae bacterium]
MRRRLIAILVLTCLLSSLFEPVVANAKNIAPDWWPYWEVFGKKDKCPVDDGTKWHAKYCSCWMPLGWAFEPIKYTSQKKWRNAQFERFWKWWSRIELNYDSMIRTEESEAKYSSDSDKIMQQSDALLKAANALCVADNFDNAFAVYFPDYVDFVSASVEELRLVQQWINLENAWVISLARYGQSREAEQKELDELYKLIWENENAIAKAEDVIKQIIGFKLGGVVDFIFGQLQTLLGYFKNFNENIKKFFGDIGELLGPAIEKIQDIAKTMTDVMQQLQNKLDSIKTMISNTIGKLPLFGEKLADYINERIDIEKIKKEFSGQLSPENFIKPMKDMFKNLENFDVEDFLKGQWKDLIEKVLSKLGAVGDILKELASLDPLKAYKYGQTQALQAVGSQAAHMALVTNRTSRELAGFMEMQLTAEHTRVARKTAVRNNMIIAGNKAKTAKGNKKVKLGFN